jgi:hypothetical protein
MDLMFLHDADEEGWNSGENPCVLSTKILKIKLVKFLFTKAIFDCYTRLKPKKKKVIEKTKC